MRIARGGMATVYEGLDLRLDRPVAIKVMHAGLADDADYVRRFNREARSAARLVHPNVVAVFDQGEDDGTLFLVMEYVPGRTLRDLIRSQGAQSPKQALALAEPVLSALAAAHRAGVVHRDVKPENVLISDDGQLKVADFGLSRTVSGETQHTATGAVLIGTVSYLAPELLTDGKGDARADVYAAGVLLHELLTGVKPHQGDSPIQVAWRHVHEDVPAPSRLVPDLPDYVDALVARATARDPDARAADASVLLHQLRRVRNALAHGLAEDSELTADLSPVRDVVPVEDGFGDALEGPDATDELEEADRPTRFPREGYVVAVSEGVPADAAADGELTTTLSTSDVRRVAEHTSPTTPQASSAVTSAARRSRRRRALLPVALVLAMVVGGLAWWFGLGRYTTTPALVTLTPAAAEDRVEEAGLSFTVSGRDWSETVPAGQVLRQTPGAGDRALSDERVSVVISRGPERYLVPELSGLEQADATALLEETNLQVGGVTERFSGRVAEGVVISSDPVVLTSLRPGSAVDLVVSRGQRPIDVPDVTGLPQQRAERRIDNANLTATTTRQNDDDVPRGQVISQTPADGTLFRGDEVALVVSDGPELVAVPDVTGAGVADARAEMEAAGFRVATRNSAVYVGLQYVLSTDPGEGSMAPRGSLITLVLV
ncbi:Stk1 family PASTA domain-containing Ser/Thr kinase [Nocardioidaceae bacterium]|nr:Stk1 family PASTA domain-containing Ser/Thr kinase [Nocardioidaceae bacterium]